MIEDIKKIIASEPFKSEYEFTLVVKDHQFKPIVVNEFDMIHDYVNNMSPMITVLFTLQQDTVANYIAPNKDDITVLIRDVNYGNIMEYKLYLETLPIDTEGNGEVFEYNVTTVKGQLESKDSIRFRACTVSGVYSSTVDRIMSSLLSVAFSFFKDKCPIRIMDTDNKENIKQLVIPSSTVAYKLPEVLQKEVGVYNGGVGYYKDYYKYYIYSIFDISKAFTKPYSLHIIASPDDRHSIGGGSFTVDNDIVSIATSKREHVEDNDYALSTLGCSVTSNSSADIMGRPLSKSMKPKPLKSNIRLKDTDTLGETYNAGNTRNLYKSRKNIMLRNGTYVTIKWVNSNHRVLYPMMSVKYTHKFNGHNVTRKGLLHKTHTTMDIKNNVEITYLTIFVETTFDKNQNTVTKL